MSGRIHSLTESISIDNRIRTLLDEEQIEFLDFDPIHGNVDLLAKFILQEFEENSKYDDPSQDTDDGSITWFPDEFK
jgi:hypothetical protein